MLSGRLQIGFPLRSKLCKVGKQLRLLGISLLDKLQFTRLKHTKELGKNANEKPVGFRLNDSIKWNNPGPVEEFNSFMAIRSC